MIIAYGQRRGRRRKNFWSLQASVATRLRSDGAAEVVSARDIIPGDQIRLSPGDRAPVNGCIIEGGSDVDVSLVTGLESAPAFMKSGDKLYAGVLNISSPLVMEARAKSEDSLIADLTRLIEAGEQAKSRYVRLADRAAALYVPLVHSLALATFAGWFFIGDARVARFDHERRRCPDNYLSPARWVLPHLQFKLSLRAGFSAKAFS